MGNRGAEIVVDSTAFTCYNGNVRDCKLNWGHYEKNFDYRSYGIFRKQNS